MTPQQVLDDLKQQEAVAKTPLESLRLQREISAQTVTVQAIEAAKPKEPEPITASFLSHLKTKDGTPMVINKDGEAVTTSLLVAEYFGKRHDSVVRSITKWLSRIEPSDHFHTFEDMIADVEVGKGATREMTYYTITEEGFALLGNSFTGEEADRFKLAYVKAFRLMRLEIVKLQAENLRLLKAEAKRLKAENYNVKDRNQYLEGKKAPWIDDHLLNNMKDAFEAEVLAHRETATKLYNGGWPSDETRGMARSRVKFVKHAGNAVLRSVRDLEGVFKGTEWEGAMNISVYLNRIKGELEFVKHW